MTRIDLTTMRFGTLVVEGYAGSKRIGSSGKRAMWNCLCDCGTVTQVSGLNLTSGNTKSHRGCLLHVSPKRCRPFEESYNVAMSNRVRKGRVNTLTYDQFLKFVTIRECHYCGDKISWAPYRDGKLRRRGPLPYNLDRKNNNIGYTLDNCVVCCRRCNWGKGEEFSYEEWRQIGTLIRSWMGIV